MLRLELDDVIFLRNYITFSKMGDMRGGGVKNLKKVCDILCERPLILFPQKFEEKLKKKLNLFQTLNSNSC